MKLNTEMLENAVHDALRHYDTIFPHYPNDKDEKRISEGCKSAIILSKFLIAHVFSHLGMWDNDEAATSAVK